MNSIKFDLFPGGKKKAVTFSYDDGQIYDEKLRDIFDKFGAKCTFNLNSDNIGKTKYITKESVRECAKTHEIACHAVTHPFLEQVPTSRIISEVYEDKKALEDIIGKPVVGMAYPFGTFDSQVVNALKAADIKYCRTTKNTFEFNYPDDYVLWHPTCHHNEALELCKKFNNAIYGLPMIYIWGHSYEFHDNNNYNLMEDILKVLGEEDDKWYATNIEIYDYMKAIKELRVTLSETAVHNPTATTVYGHVNGKYTEFKPGLTTLKD